LFSGLTIADGKKIQSTLIKRLVRLNAEFFVLSFCYLVEKLISNTATNERTNVVV